MSRGTSKRPLAISSCCAQAGQQHDEFNNAQDHFIRAASCIASAASCIAKVNHEATDDFCVMKPVWCWPCSDA
eukprot:4445169-Pleurochrysis_carterae.AAC.1